ncbi:MAG: hypothetical protein LBT53_02495, partial [Puniceicoccales bacterium]|nr:hypothetical protein [Puniceicoccales bacterium]
MTCATPSRSVRRIRSGHHHHPLLNQPTAHSRHTNTMKITKLLLLSAALAAALAAAPAPTASAKTVAVAMTQGTFTVRLDAIPENVKEPVSAFGNIEQYNIAVCIPTIRPFGHPDGIGGSLRSVSKDAKNLNLVSSVQMWVGDRRSNKVDTGDIEYIATRAKGYVAGVLDKTAVLRKLPIVNGYMFVVVPDTSGGKWFMVRGAANSTERKWPGCELADDTSPQKLTFSLFSGISTSSGNWIDKA